jgi:hypothetical protein
VLEGPDFVAAAPTRVIAAVHRTGVTMVGGTVVTDPDPCLDLIAEGASGYHLFGHCAEKTLVRRAEVAADR